MKPIVRLTAIKDLVFIEPVVFADSRGSLFETYHQEDFAAMCQNFEVAQTYQSRSNKGVLRGLHYQNQEAPVAKIVRCSRGIVFDIAVDIRINSATFGRWCGTELSEKNNIQFYIPVGFAHGFVALSDVADVHYHQSGIYNPKAEGCIIWNDKDLNIDWPTASPLVSDKDIQGISLEEYQCNPAF